MLQHCSSLLCVSSAAASACFSLFPDSAFSFCLSNSAIFKYLNCAQISNLHFIGTCLSSRPSLLFKTALLPLSFCTGAFIPSSQSKIHLHPSHPGVARSPLSPLHTFILSYCSVIQRRKNLICILDISLGAERA